MFDVYDVVVCAAENFSVTIILDSASHRSKRFAHITQITTTYIYSHITLYICVGLSGAKWGGSNDAYCHVTFSSYISETTVKKNSANPFWDEQLVSFIYYWNILYIII